MTYDLSIIGAGLVGSSLALALANQNIRVRLCDLKPALMPSEKPDLRVVALNLSSIAWLKQAGIFSQLDRERLGIFDSVAVSSQGQDLVFESAQLGQKCLGVIAENNQVIARAQQACLNHSNIQSEFSIETEYDPQDPRLVIAADGLYSPLRQALNIPLFTHDYAQNAWIARVNLEKPHHKQAWQVFLPGGPLAFLPLHDEHQASVVWTLPKSSEGFSAEEITKASASRYGEIRLDSERVKFPLKIQLAEHYFKNNVVFLGDAIHGIHPLAGQGVNLGFADAQALFDLLIAHPSKFWTRSLFLKKYQRARKSQNMLTAHSMSLINSLFASQILGIPQARNLGMQIFSQSSFLKNTAISLATGLSDF